MSELLWKAVRRDWTSRGGVRWGIGETVVHPTSTAMTRDNARTYLSLSDEPAETLLGRDWPCRLLRVEPVGKVLDSDAWPHKRCALAARVVAEVEPWRALGPNGRTVAAVIDRCGRLTDTEARSLAAVEEVARYATCASASNVAREAARAAAWTGAWTGAWVGARAAPVDVARAAAGDAAQAVVVADLITPEHYAAMTAPLVSVVGPLDELPVPAWVDEPTTGGA